MILSEKPEYKIKGGDFLHIKEEILNVSNYIAIYTDIIEEQYFGDALVPILRCVNLFNGKDPISINFDNPFYVGVNKDFISTINIKIADLQGNLIRFKDFFSYVIVTLHFRKVKDA